MIEPIAIHVNEIADIPGVLNQTLMIWKNGNPNGHFKKKFVACVGGNCVEDDDADLAAALAVQKYIWHVKALKENGTI